MIKQLLLIVCFLANAGMALAADAVDKTLFVVSEGDFPPFAVGRTDCLRLSMVQRIVEKCGGRIWVESDGLDQDVISDLRCRMCYFEKKRKRWFRIEQWPDVVIETWVCLLWNT